MKTFEGKLVSKSIKVGIVAARFNEFITSKLLSGALDGLLRREIEAAGGKLGDVQHGEQVTLAFTLAATAADSLLVRLNESGQGRIVWWPEDEG